MSHVATDRSRSPLGRARFSLRVALLAGAAAAALALLLLGLALRTAESVADRVFASGARQIADLAAAEAGGAVKFGKADILGAQFEKLHAASQGAAVAAVALNAAGEVVASFGEADEALRALAARTLAEGAEAASPDGLSLGRLVRFGRDAQPAGALAMRWSDDAIAAEIAATAWTLGAGGIGLAVALAVAGGISLMRALGRPLLRLQDAVGEMLAGRETDVPGLDRRDEIGGLARALRAIHDFGRESLRLRQALESSSTLLMVADDAHRIVYATPSVVAMLREAEAEIRARDLPNFRADEIVGSSIDVFHKRPEVQRGRLGSLDAGGMDANLALGGRSMTLHVTPVHDPAGRRIGTAVEWRDRTDEIAALTQIKAVAVGVAAGDFSLRARLDAAAPELRQAMEEVNRICETVDAFLADVEEPLAALAEGDVTRRAGGDWRGRFGQTATALNATVGRLAELSAETRRAEAAMRGAIAEVSEGAADLSARTESQASALEETSATVEEISATISANADSARDAAGLAAEARGRAGEGRAVADRAVASMQEIEESSSRINDITAVIDSIAFQTNLLALNAAVEAARAGDAGKGFAVVASEVRTLAQRSSAAARDIKELISASGAKVADGVRHVRATGEALGELEAAIVRMSGVLEDIARASAEQATGMQEITSAVSHLDDATQQNAALAESSARSAGALRSQAETLAELIGFFRDEGARGIGAAPRRTAA